ncbi:FAD-dependent monooxygenase [Streptomyces sp. XD-27]|uniref:FAD-dependent monooxygenase n=1 Tax=Streptomyces sp. XD-27 TaxID=3062779 RepID=UPI0026F42DEC|nr:FAD-dependent monooxygenase [Streptomyces sp. XD-27]WKX70818.1 FAD-dependent monooxygenase [Streptomyces sp. XD-27]
MPAEEASIEVLVVGAGPAGLTLAVDLARRGIRALVVERGAELFPGSRGKGLQPRTQEVFDDLGVIGAVRAAGGPYPPMMDWDGDRRLGAFQMIDSVEPTPGAPYHEVWMLPQWRTSRILYERLLELGGGVRFGTELTGFAQDADGVEARLRHADGVEARLRHADGSTTTVGARYLVAADGGRSTVRAALGIGMTGETVDPRPMLVADVRIDGIDADHWHVWQQAPGGGIALCPLAGTDHFQVVAGYEDTDAVPDTSPEAVRRLVADRTPLTAADVREVLWASTFRTRAAMADRFREGRVFLVGDAAHVHSPAGGQGLNTSVQDAYNLGWKLAHVLRHGADPALLDSYEEERLPVAAGVLGISTRIHRAAMAGDAEGQQRTAEVHQLGLSYRGGPLAAELRHALPQGALRAGDRAPDAPCALPDLTPHRLFDAFRGPHFTLLALGGCEPPPYEGDLLRTYAVGGPAPDLLDTAGHIRGGYAERGLFLIRPDGYVALAAPATPDGTRALADHLRRYGVLDRAGAGATDAYNPRRSAEV